jgi:hypothetical protein
MLINILCKKQSRDNDDDQRDVSAVTLIVKLGICVNYTEATARSPTDDASHFLLILCIPPQSPWAFVPNPLEEE